MKKIYFISAFLFSATLLLAQSGSQTFTQTGSFIVPLGVSSITVEVVGAGGSGAGNGSGGGGGGGYAKGVYNVTAGSNLAVTIGVGGSGAINGTSSVSSFISATGGANGTTVPNPTIGGGGNGGSGMNGTIANRTGGNGGGGYWTYFGGGGGGAGGSLSNGTVGGNTIAYSSGNCFTPGGSGGAGGGAPGGNGGKGAGFIDNFCNAANPSAAGSAFGGGGGGGNGNSAPAGAGANGYCNISWGASPCVAPSSPIITNSVSQLTVCGGSATLTAASSGTVNWFTSPSGGSAVGTGTTYITPAFTTTTIFYAEAMTCTNSISRTAVTITIYPYPLISISPSTPTVCSGQSIVVNANGASTYSWSYASTPIITYSVGPTVVLSPSVSTLYQIKAADASGCTIGFPFALTVVPTATLNVTTSNTVICAGNISTITATGSTFTTYAPINVLTATLSSSGFLVKPPVSTTYTITAFGQSGCSSSVTVFIEVIAAPTLSIVSSNNLVCRLQTVTLTASGANTYSWSNNGSTASILVNGLFSNTTFTAIGTNTNGCSNFATYTQTVVNCTGISSNNEQESVLRVFPNPNNGEFSVSSRQNLKLNLVNDMGQLIKTFELDELNQHSFTVRNVTAGIYFIVSADADKGLYQKIVVTD